MIEIDEEKCSGCNLCYTVCMGGPIFKGPEIRYENGAMCIECGHCYAICPENAVTMKGFEGMDTHELGEKPAVDGKAMMALLRGRRSGRMYRPEPVSREHVMELIEAASLAPSAHNSHPVKAYVYYNRETIDEVRNRTIRYYRRLLRLFNVPGFPAMWRMMGQDPEELEILKHAFQELWASGKQDDMLYFDSRTLLVFTAPRYNALALGDAWIAAQNAVDYAEAIEVSTCYNGYLIMAANQNPRVKSALGIPRGEKVAAALTLGYPKRRFAREAPRGMMEVTWS